MSAAYCQELRLSTRLTRFTGAVVLSGLTCLLAPSARAEEDAVEDADMLKVGGALRVNAFYKTWLGEEDNRNHVAATVSKIGRASCRERVL